MIKCMLKITATIIILVALLLFCQRVFAFELTISAPDACEPYCDCNCIRKATYTLEADKWNLISLPVVPLLELDSKIEPDFSCAYKQEETLIRVDTEDIQQNGKGYWALSPGGQYSIDGALFEIVSRTLNPGWNLVGGCSGPTEILPVFGNILAVYEFNKHYTYTNKPDKILLPGEGYWVYYDHFEPGEVFFWNID